MRDLLATCFFIGFSCQGFAEDISVDAAKMQAIPEEVWVGMQNKSFHSDVKGCAQRADLVLLSVPYWDYRGQAKMGELVVHTSVGAEILEVFKTLYTDRSYAFDRIERIDVYDGDDRASMTANNTSAYNCRLVAGSNRLSSHAKGLAIDINPFTNPFVTSKLTSPPGAEAYDTPAERLALKGKPGLILRRGVLTKAFAAKGWKWGGNWTSLKDYQHFSKDGK
jgi:hypothetical protein